MATGREPLVPLPVPLGDLVPRCRRRTSPITSKALRLCGNSLKPVPLKT